MPFIYLFVPLAIFVLWLFLVRGKRNTTGAYFAEFFIKLALVLSFILFSFAMQSNPGQYNESIDPVDIGYSPFGYDHLLTLVVYYILFLFACYKLWQNEHRQPPLALVLYLVIVLLGVLISIVIIRQVNIEFIPYGNGPNYECFWLFEIHPIVCIFTGLLLMARVIRQYAQETVHKEFPNKHLNQLNLLLGSGTRLSVGALLLLLPVFIIITMILLLFGQQTDSIVRVFTDTTDWHFSQHHPLPYKDHQGHYLCTVAAKGHSSVVKPLRLGTRCGQTIVVNRQLMVANAWEELIHDFSPRLHQTIRAFYDQYGFPLSRYINTPLRSSVVYVLMKPLEWFFVISLYLFSLHPEEKINQQYKPTQYA